MKKLGFLSFGHWMPQSPIVRTASDAYLQSIDLAVEAEKLGIDGAYFRVHHFATQIGSPYPLLAAIGAKTSKIEIGTGVVDMRYENPFYMAETASITDIITQGRVQLGVGRGSPEQVLDGWKYFGYDEEGDQIQDTARERTLEFLKLIEGTKFAEPNPLPMFPQAPGKLRLEPYAEGLRQRIWWGAGSTQTAVWAAEHGMNLESSTLVNYESTEPFHIQQLKQLLAYKEAWKQAGHDFEPRTIVTRSIQPITNDLDRQYFGRGGDQGDSVGYLAHHNHPTIFGRTYADEPDKLVKQLAEDEAVKEADTLLLTVPNTLGVDYNVHLLETIMKEVAPALGWK